MAVFHRLFSSKSRHSSTESHFYRPETVQKPPVAPKLDKSKIRLVIFADTDHGRTPYFDSNAIRKVDESDKNLIKTQPRTMRCSLLNRNIKEQQIPHQKATPKYHFQRLGSDVKVLEEMMFGSVAMAHKGTSLKIHLLRTPSQLMVTKVFIPEKPSNSFVSETEADPSSLPGSYVDLSSGEFSLPLRKNKERYVSSNPMDVPIQEYISDSSTDDDSGLASFTSSGSLRSPFPSPSNNSVSSYNSLHRRWMRAQTTTLDGSQRAQRKSGLVTERTVSRSKRKMLAIGILFGPNDEKEEESNKLFQSFFFSHFALIEGHVEKLRSVIEKAYFNQRNFLPAVMEALEAFRSNVYDLYLAPRLQDPVWLTMMSTSTYKTRLCAKFMQEFVYLVGKFDNKNCKFFVSTLISAVLTHHLAWVATVTPAGGPPSKTYLDKHSAKWVDTLAKTHPYNPLWAQLGDLFGAIGLPLRISRTVVIGKKADVVKRFLYILSYFIRCSDIHENSDLDCLANLLSQDPMDSVSSADKKAEDKDGNITPLESSLNMSGNYVRSETPLEDSGSYIRYQPQQNTFENSFSPNSNVLYSTKNYSEDHFSVSSNRTISGSRTPAERLSNQKGERASVGSRNSIDTSFSPLSDSSSRTPTNRMCNPSSVDDISNMKDIDSGKRAPSSTLDISSSVSEKITDSIVTSPMFPINNIDECENSYSRRQVFCECGCECNNISTEPSNSSSLKAQSKNHTECQKCVNNKPFINQGNNLHLHNNSTSNYKPRTCLKCGKILSHNRPSSLNINTSNFSVKTKDSEVYSHNQSLVMDIPAFKDRGICSKAQNSSTNISKALCSQKEVSPGKVLPGRTKCLLPHVEETWISNPETPSDIQTNLHRFSPTILQPDSSPVGQSVTGSPDILVTDTELAGLNPVSVISNIVVNPVTLSSTKYINPVTTISPSNKVNPFELSFAKEVNPVKSTSTRAVNPVTLPSTKAVNPVTTTSTKAGRPSAATPVPQTESSPAVPFNSLPICSLTTSRVVESPNREVVNCVAKAADTSASTAELDSSIFSSPASNNIPILRSQSFSVNSHKSRLSQQLESEKVKVTDEAQKVKVAALRKQFLSEGSSSMFEEYFEPGVEVKTIDDLSEKERVFISSTNSVSSRISLVEVKKEVKKDSEAARPPPGLFRQNSSDVKTHATRPHLGKQGSITPTELSRRRHLSSTGSIDYDTPDPLNHCIEVKMPEAVSDSSQWNIKAFDRNFGRSLLAGYTDHYMSDFVLHGTADSDFKPRLLHDLQMTVQHSILDEPLDEAVCVIADTDNWTVEVASSKVIPWSPSGCTAWTSSQLVADLIESVMEIYRLKMSPEFCLMHLEDRLQEIYFKSLMLSEYLRGTTVYNQRELTSMLGFESSDMALLLAIAGTHTPSLNSDSP